MHLSFSARFVFPKAWFLYDLVLQKKFFTSLGFCLSLLFVYSWILQKIGFCVRSEASSVENCHSAATFNSSAVQIAGTFSRLHPTSLHNGQLIEKLKWRQKLEKSIENTVFAGFCRNQTEGVTDFPLHCFSLSL